MTRRAWPAAVGWALGIILGLGSEAGAQANRARFRIEPTAVIAAISPPGASIGKESDWTVNGQNLSKVDRWDITGKGVVVVGFKATSDTTAELRVKVEPGAEPGYREVRAIGPGGISNLNLIRVDPLDQIHETEPNNEPAKASAIAIGQAACGTIQAQDLDYYRLDARAGMRLTIEVEARRIGTPIVPVVTVMTAAGTALAMARETPGTEHDARLSLQVPADGTYLIEVRDSLYGGGDSAGYRLRVEQAPYATAIFPLGGPAGQSIAIEASGGNLAEPRSRTIALPDAPGTIIEAGAFDGPGGPVVGPMKIEVGDGPEVLEGPADERGISGVEVPLGSLINGRLERPGEVDRYRVEVSKGDVIHLRVRASDLGSWLDSVVTVRDESGRELAENDDAGVNGAGPQNVFQPNLSPPDSRLDYKVAKDGVVILEITDRYGDGGPEYGYRLEVGRARPDVAIRLLFGDVNANRRGAQGRNRRARVTPGANGALNLRPGTKMNINFLLTAEGKTGPIEVRAEGLPPGITARAVTIRPPAPAGNMLNPVGVPTGGALVLDADADADAALGTLRIVARARLDDGTTISRTATATIDVETPLPRVVSSRPITRTLAEIPVRVLGEAVPNDRKEGFVGPPVPSDLSLKAIKVPGVLLQGGRIDLTLVTEPASPRPGSYTLEAKAEGKGLAIQTLVPESLAATSELPEAIVRVIALPDAMVGGHPIAVTLRPAVGPAIMKMARVTVRPPLKIEAIPREIAIAPGGSAELGVMVERESGFEGPVTLRLTLPKGVKATGSLRLGPDEVVKKVRLEMAAGAVPLEGRPELRVAAEARMARGPVRVESAIRPMLLSRPAEK